jgi:hypothetical protein
MPDARCKERADGPVAAKLILAADGRVYCDQCAEGRERAARRRERKAPTPAGIEQGDLFAELV